MDNLIRIWAEKNINKPGKPLQFDSWSGQNYWIDPAIIDYIDPVKLEVYCGDNLVFKMYQNRDMKELIDKVNGNEEREK